MIYESSWAFLISFPFFSKELAKQKDERIIAFEISRRSTKLIGALEFICSCNFPFTCFIISSSPPPSYNNQYWRPTKSENVQCNEEMQRLGINLTNCINQECNKSIRVGQWQSYFPSSSISAYEYSPIQQQPSSEGHQTEKEFPGNSNCLRVLLYNWMACHSPLQFIA